MRLFLGTGKCTPTAAFFLRNGSETRDSEIVKNVFPRTGPD